jgi:acetylornithine deacetylase/succinyl-diaminopimelate desuccinylase-like protein
MADLAVNIPEVVDEVRRAFERYERALADGDVAVLDETFWNSPHTVRYARDRQGHGWVEIHAHRVAQSSGMAIRETRIRLEILTLGRHIATVNLEYKNRGSDRIGRQSQTWVRFPDHGWKVVGAHVSMIETPA